MWQTPAGVRKLDGAERRLFLNGIIRMTEHMNDPEYDLMAEVLQHLNHLDRRHAFLSVAHHLTNGSLPPRLLAWSSAVIEEVFDFLRAEVEMEIDSQKRFPDICTFTRHLVRGAAMEALEAFPQYRRNLPRARSVDVNLWRLLIRKLRERVLGGDSHLRYHEIADLPPQKAARKLKRWKVDEDYFSALPPIFPEVVKKAFDTFEKSTSEEIEGCFQKYVRKSGRKQNI